MANNEENTTGKILKNLLKEHHLSQKECSLRAGITEAAMSHYIKGDRVPRGATLLNIANVLHTSTDVLLGVEENSNPQSAKEACDQIIQLVARHGNQITDEDKYKLVKAILKN